MQFPIKPKYFPKSENPPTVTCALNFPKTFSYFVWSRNFFIPPTLSFLPPPGSEPPASGSRTEEPILELTHRRNNHDGNTEGSNWPLKRQQTLQPKCAARGLEVTWTRDSWCVRLRLQSHLSFTLGNVPSIFFRKRSQEVLDVRMRYKNTYLGIVGFV